VAAKRALQALKESEMPANTNTFILKRDEEDGPYKLGGVACIVAHSIVFSGMIGGGYDYECLGDYPKQDTKEFGIDFNSKELQCKRVNLYGSAKILVGETGYIETTLIGKSTRNGSDTPFFFIFLKDDEESRTERLEPFQKIGFQFESLE
jgi:hypothetical protein